MRFGMKCELALLAVATLAVARSQAKAGLLGSAESFAVLGGSTVTNTGPTILTGELGVWPGSGITGFPAGVVNGTIHSGDAVARQAQDDVTTAYNILAGVAFNQDLTGQDLGGLTLNPGVYRFSSSAQLTGSLTLDALGDPDALFVFQIGSTLTTASSSTVLVINGGDCNVFWQVGSSATLGTDIDFKGSILALASISLNTGADILAGRALAREGAVTMGYQRNLRPVHPGACDRPAVRLRDGRSVGLWKKARRRIGVPKATRRFGERRSGREWLDVDRGRNKTYQGDAASVGRRPPVIEAMAHLERFRTMKRVLALFGIVALAAAGGCACARASASAHRTCKQDCREKVTLAPVYPADPVCYTDPDLVGPRGPDGAAGSVGERGATGQTGAPGYAVAGPRGGPGAMGNPGEQGPTGATGPSGMIVRGRTGVQGPVGDVGAQGATGATGARGDSAAGFAGASGPQGPIGPEGAIGGTGGRGPTMEGPAGPAGRQGPAGAQGLTGHAGAQGSTTAGVAGPVGLAGTRGPQGATGEIGAQGPVGEVGCWTSFREFWFQTNSAEILDSEKYKLADIATYMNRNPSLNLGLDGAVGSGGTEARNQNLSDRRTKAIREGLVAAGVPSHKISVGAYGDATLQRDRRVEVLFASAN